MLIRANGIAGMLVLVLVLIVITNTCSRCVCEGVVNRVCV